MNVIILTIVIHNWSTNYNVFKSHVNTELQTAGYRPDRTCLQALPRLLAFGAPSLLMADRINARDRTAQGLDGG